MVLVTGKQISKVVPCLGSWTSTVCGLGPELDSLQA